MTAAILLNIGIGAAVMDNLYWCTASGAALAGKSSGTVKDSQWVGPVFDLVFVHTKDCPVIGIVVVGRSSPRADIVEERRRLGLHSRMHCLEGGRMK